MPKGWICHVAEMNVDASSAQLSKLVDCHRVGSEDPCSLYSSSLF